MCTNPGAIWRAYPGGRCACCACINPGGRYAAPLTDAVKLELGGAHAGRALVWKKVGKHEGNVCGDVELGEGEDGMSVRLLLLSALDNLRT